MVEMRERFVGSVLRIDDFDATQSVEAPPAEEVTTSHEIALVRTGMFTRHDASGSFTADANYAVFFQRAQPYRVTYPNAEGDACTVFNIADFALIDMLRTFNPATADRPDHPFPKPGHVLMTSAWHLAHFRLLRWIASGCDSLQLEESALLLLGDMLRTAYQRGGQYRPEKKTRAAPARQEIVAQVKAELAAQFCESLHLEVIARRVYVSPYWLCRAFRAETGVSLHQYVLRLRLAHALEYLLERPQEDLTHIALSLGFYSHSHFTTLFTRAFGLSPSEFRKPMPLPRLREISKIMEA
ncbi:MAG: helix-turn-helix transcriptional regulator [Anaerolineae bacterium]|nr:helix-turn-helix transcriptional regulator [Anaerolineae bacterium]